MTRSTPTFACLALLLGAAALEAQNAPSKPPVPAPATNDGSRTQSDRDRQKAPAPSAPAAQQFPYPGEEKPAGDPALPGTGKGSAAPVPEAPDGAGGKAFPYPGDPDAGSSSSSSSSSSSASSSSTGDVPDTGHPARRKLPKVTHLQSDEDRAYEDLDVARFYRDKGDLHAAYLRAQDATKALPKLAEAHLLLGEIAGKMSRHDEAVTELSAYLKLEPDGDHVKQVRRMLAQMR